MPKNTEKDFKNHRRIPTQARARAKYDAVLDACTQVLAQQGFSKATMLELSFESDVAVPTIYQYFENKEAIFLAWLERIIDRVLQSVSHKESELQNEQLSVHIEQLTLTAMLLVSSYAPSMRNLLADISDALSAQMVHTMEEKTILLLQNLFAKELNQMDKTNIIFKLRILVRMIIGYFIQSIMNSEREIEAQQEATEISNIVKAYLISIKIKI